MPPTQSVEEIGCRPTDGTVYTGQANTSVGRRVCQMWTAKTPHDSFYPEVGDNNYCRNPDGDDGLWCYTTDPTKGWDYCHVPDCVKQNTVDCIPTDGTAYTGKKSTTKSGRTCQMWSRQMPHKSNYPNTGEHNYCRSPDGDAIWCYTSDPKKQWEYCHVPLCMPHTKGIR